MTQTANVYARALYELCAESNCCDRVLEQIRALENVFLQNSDYVRLLSAPNLSKEERVNALDEVLRNRVDEYVLSTLKLLTEKGAAKEIASVCRDFRTLYNEDHGILPVTALTAVALSDAQKQKLQEKLCRITGKQVELENKVEKDLLGGVKLRYDGTQVDDTVRRHLDAVRTMLQNTML